MLSGGAVLERAAERIDDLVGASMRRFYAVWPDAEESFEFHGMSKRAELETEMVLSSLHCLMSWWEHRSEIKIVLHDFVPHHDRMLSVPPEWFAGLLTSVIEVIGETGPEDHGEERELIQEAQREPLAEIELSGHLPS